VIPLIELHRIPLAGSRLTAVTDIAEGTGVFVGESSIIDGETEFRCFVWDLWGCALRVGRYGGINDRIIDRLLRSSIPGVRSEVENAHAAIFRQYPGTGSVVARSIKQAALATYLLEKSHGDGGRPLGGWWVTEIDHAAGRRRTLDASELSAPAPGRRSGISAAIRRELNLEAFHASKPDLLKSREREAPPLDEGEAPEVALFDGGDDDPPSVADPSGRGDPERSDPTGNQAALRVVIHQELDNLRFTDRQREVLWGSLQGFTQVEIAARLGISRSTVATTWATVQKKLPDL